MKDNTHAGTGTEGEPSTENPNRRTYLRSAGGATIAAVLAGCLSGVGEEEEGNGDGGSGEFTVGEIANEGNNCMSCVAPTPSFEMPDRIDEESDGAMTMNLQPENAVCDTTDCGSNVESNVIAAGYGSIGNSTAFFPENQIWLIPYTFPSRAQLSYTLFHEESWENYWVPFARKYNVIPFYTWTPALRQVMISEDATEELDGEELRRPEQLEGLTIRRTSSRVADVSLSTWGADATEVSWEDTVQGMETGVVDGLETWSSVAIADGIGEVTDQVVDIDFKCGQGVLWANTDWLQGLSEDQRGAVADATRDLTEEAVHIADEVIDERVGQQDPPPEGSSWDELDVTVNVLDDDELAAWQEPLDPQENPELWEPERELMEDLEAPDDFYDTIYETARESDAPDSPEEFTIDAWWDDYLDEI